MFTGLIEEVGTIVSIDADGPNARLQISVPQLASEICEGDSIAVNGCCLTVTSRRSDGITFDLSQETLARSNLGRLRNHDSVNVERALTMNGRLGGHFVQGHIDCTAVICALDQNGRLEIAFERERMRFVVEKGSIAVNGISLTVAELGKSHLVSWIIPHTLRHTNLRSARAGDLVNIEFDILAKYVARLLPGKPPDV